MFRSSAARRFQKKHQAQKYGNNRLLSCDIRILCLSLVALLLTIEVVVLLTTATDMGMSPPPTGTEGFQGGLRSQRNHENIEKEAFVEADKNVRSFDFDKEEDPLDSPRLDELMKRLQAALQPFQMKYMAKQASKRGETLPPCQKLWQTPKKGFYLAGCPSSGCRTFGDLGAAQQECEKVVDCGGIVSDGEHFEIRMGDIPIKAPKHRPETTYLLADACKKPSTAMGVWETFVAALSDALMDDSLNLDKSYGPAREDDSIYLSIASYRDNTCPLTLKQAYSRAANPENLFVGIVQQNCLRDCMTGTGWGATRKWIEGDPDVDCLDDFCASKEGKPFCDNNQIRILRLEEVQSYGPFFSRFLNSKLWRGETFYLQIDAHTEFRSRWDESLIKQMKDTPSYPFSVISNYPPSGSPKIDREWEAHDGSTYQHTPSALCGCRFEDAGGRHKTVRLLETSRGFKGNVDKSIPHQSLFVAAGFFIAHGSIVDNVPFDPFMPYLFMGEEIALSVRFWTSGYDIYGPAVNVLRHEYVRKESPKFWESVTMIFSNGMIHNRLTDIIIPRVQVLLGFDEGAGDREKIKPKSILAMADRYSVGTKRSVDEYVRIAGFNLDKMNQRTPKWCLHGTDTDQ